MHKLTKKELEFESNLDQRYKQPPRSKDDPPLFPIRLESYAKGIECRKPLGRVAQV